MKQFLVTSRERLKAWQMKGQKGKKKSAFWVLLDQKIILLISQLKGM
ncbi:unnamed protein product [Paramecium primaurelia]|uniref:Uncharacterized protein n=1 Tax=Paramecium primaurelia TaxID=5886 RepID=A0A8S1P2G3_PARPR|nr:unnamed protein product [Paramecium primaurelia]